MLLIASAPDPVLVRVTLCAELFVPNVWGAKVMLVADNKPTPLEVPVERHFFAILLKSVIPQHYEMCCHSI
jgi:hypothetical protein